MTADNSFRLKVNNRDALEGDNFHETYHADLTGLLKPGENDLYVIAENGGNDPNPAGLLGLFVVRYADGSLLNVATDTSWLSAKEALGRRVPAMALGPSGMAPWFWHPSSPAAELYPSYATVAGILTEIGY